MRLRKRPWITEAIKQYAAIIPEPQREGDWQKLFDREAPLHVELGTGRGGFISELATRNPEINYIGIEANQDVLYYAAQKVAERQIANIRLLLLNVENITDIFTPGEVSRLYINFCDPWPKKRHTKRRLTNSRFLERYRSILIKGGELFFKTDNQALFEFSLTEFAGANLKLRNVTFDLHNDDFGENVITEYEAKFSAKGMKIFRCEVIFE